MPRLPPEAVAGFCGLPAESIRRIARQLSEAPRAAVYGRSGTCNQEFGTLASWARRRAQRADGHLDREGGAMFSNPIAPSLMTLPPPDFAEGFRCGRWRSRVRGAPEVLGQVPISCLAEEIATPGEGQVKALITIAGNPVLSAPDAGKLDAALPALECMISVDNWLNETSRHAHVILPGSSVLEQPHYDEAIWGWAVRNAGKVSQPVFDPPPERPAEWQVLLTLAAVVQGAKVADVDVGQLDQLFFAGLVAGIAADPRSSIAGRDPAEIVAACEGSGQSASSTSPSAAAPGARASAPGPRASPSRSSPPCPTASTWAPSSRAFPECPDPVGQGRARARLHHLRSPRLRARIGERDEGLVLVSRRHVRSNNSWMHNVKPLVSGRDRCTLLVHPDDAAAAGLADGGRARVSSGRAAWWRRWRSATRCGPEWSACPTAGATTSPARSSRWRPSTPASATTCSRPASWWMSSPATPS